MSTNTLLLIGGALALYFFVIRPQQQAAAAQTQTSLLGQGITQLGAGLGGIVGSFVV